MFVAGTGDFGGGHELALLAHGAASGDPLMAFSRTTTSFAASSTTGIEIDVWRPVLAVFISSTSRKLYYYNDAVGTNTDSSAPTFSNFDRFVVGVSPIADADWFNGDIAEVAIWNAELTQVDFNSLKAGALPNSIKSDDLIDYWSLETQASTQTGVNNTVLTATNTAQADDHPPVGVSVIIDLSDSSFTFKKNNGEVLASLDVTFWVHDATTGELVA